MLFFGESNISQKFDTRVFVMPKNAKCSIIYIYVYIYTTEIMEVVPPFESFRWCFPCFCYWIMFCALQSVAYPMGSTISIISLFLS